MPIDCQATDITVYCTSGCNNNTINGGFITVSGNTITFDVDVTQPLICTPALRFFNVAQSATLPSGSYTLVVNYVENGSVITTTTRPLSVGSCCPADPTFSRNISGDICGGDSITFTASVAGQNSYTWKVDGMTVSNSTTLNQTFATQGVYDVRLIVSDGTCDDSASVMVNVGGYPVINLDSLVDESCAAANNGKVFITPTGGATPYSYEWQNGLRFQNQTFAAGGPIWVEVTDRYGCASRDTFLVGTGNSVFASFNFKDRFVICENDSLELISTSTGATTYQWMANGNMFSTSSSTKISFDSAGIYEISLFAIDGACRDTANQLITVSSPGSISATITQPSCPGLQNGSIDISLSGGFGPFVYDWSNGAQSQNISALDSGTFVLIVEDSALCRLQETFRLDLSSNGIIAAFDFSRPNDTVYFRDQSDSTAVSWLWDFGDGTSSTQQNPGHAYSETDDFTICLTVTDAAGCQDSSCTPFSYTVGLNKLHLQSIQVYPNPFSNKLYLSIPAELGEATISVFDLQGREVVRMPRKEDNIELGELEKGIYWIRIEGKGWDYSKTIIKH